MDKTATGLVAMPVTPGELLDRITILRIKRERARSQRQRRELAATLARAEAAWTRGGFDDASVADLAAVLTSINRGLWQAEDRVRACGRRGDFGTSFVACARKIMNLNDRRAVVRREISTRLGAAAFDDVKVYGPEPRL